MFKQLFIFLLVLMYLYTLTFNIFMTSVFRIPAPLIFCIPLIFLFRNRLMEPFRYKFEVIVFFLAAGIYFLIGQQVINLFFAVVIIIVCCSLYFNYFIGYDFTRFKMSIWIFYSLLSLSAIIMLLDHIYKLESIRSLLIGEPVMQSPSGISVFIFTYGYQLAALVSFLAILSATHKKSLIIHLFTIGICMILILYGMQRSVLITFLFSVVVFWLLFYRYKVVLMFGLIIIMSISLSSSIEVLTTGTQQNILTKNEKNKEAGENRGGLLIENFKVISNYPFGLIFYGKTWNDVVKHNPVYKSGIKTISSHNAYLMFLTYSGLVLSLLFFYLIYRKIFQIIIHALRHIKDKNNALMVCLSFSFLSISLNSFFHNEWLLAASGPTLFLYFSILQLDAIQNKKAQSEPDSKEQPKLIIH